LLCDFETCELDAGEEKLFMEQSQLTKSLKKDFCTGEKGWNLYARDILGYEDNSYWM